jgi:hypothetical protein
LDDRQDIIGQLSSFQASQPEEAAQRGEEQAARQRCPTVHSGQPKVFSRRTMSNWLAFGRQRHRSAGSGASQQ